MKRKLLLAMAAVLSIAGVQRAKAYTTSDLTSAGWTQVSSIADVDNNYYVFVDAETSEYAMARTTNGRPVYQKLTSPLSQSNLVWMLEDASDGKYYIKSYFDNYYFYSGNAGWNNSMQASDKSALTFTLSEGKYMISDETFTDWKYLGPWNGHNYLNADKGWSQDQKEAEYQRIVDNKKSSSETAGDISEGFLIFSMPKTTYAANCRNEAALVNEGWSKVTEATGLGKAGFYYTFLDSELPGLVMAHTSAIRPVYQPLGDPTSDATQCWTTESYYEGYAIKSVSDNTYIYNTATWNCQFGNLQAGAEYLFTLNDGKWKLRNTIAGESEFLGKWYDFNDYPFADEGIAANKTSTGVKEWLIYSIPTIAGVATELPANGDMAADTWYYIDINAAADNYTATATKLGDIVYTTDGTILVKNGSTVTANFTAEDNSLSAVRYYVKSSSANNLVIGVSSYTYTVGVPTQSIADGAYVGGLTTIDFNYTSAGSTDPDATFALLNNTATASLKKAGAEVATGTLSLSGKVLTATFSDITLDQSSTYTIDIAAGVVGYEDLETSTAISTTIKTGIIADGIYYFKKSDEYKYLTRGGNYGTETVVDNYGISLQAMIQADGTYYLKNVDHSLSANTDKFLNMYTDQGAYAWTIAAATGGYYLKYTDGKYMTTNYVDYTDGNNNTNRYYYQSGTETEGDAIVWKILSKSEYATSLAAKKNAEIAALATSAGISASTLSEFETALSSGYGETDMTSSISNPLCNSASDWTAVSYNGGSTYTAIDYHTPTIQIYNRTGGITQTIEGLSNGIYKVTVSATWRPGNSAAATRAGNDANTTAWIYANDNITQLKGWYEGGGEINSTQNLVDNADDYLNTVYAYVSDGTLKIGVAVPSFCEQNWCPIYNWTLTYYEAKATDAEKEALADAITAAEGKTLGFEANEYAPYNNVAALEALAAAKAIDPASASGAAVVAATTALSGATWTKNDAEVNAICGGDFTQYETVGGQDLPYGWNLYNDGNNNSRIMGGTEGTSNTGLSAATSGKALLMKFNATYGESEGYTMPLKAGKVYKISFKYGGWNNAPATIVSLKDPSDADITLAPNFRPATSDAYSNAEDWYNYTGYFVSTTAGNYKLNFTKVESGQQQIVIADIELKSSTDALEFADGSLPTYAPGTYPSVKITRSLAAGNWATAVYPFAVSGVDNIAVLDSYDKAEGALGFKSATESEANVPFLMRSTADKSDISLSNVEVAAAAATDAIASEASLKGTYAATDIDAGTGVYNYVLSNNQIFKVGANSATINPYRAYIQIAQDTPAKLRFVIDGEDATGIESIAAEAENTLDGQVYDMSGRLVKNPVKGMYIVNGKKILVK